MKKQELFWYRNKSNNFSNNVIVQQTYGV